MADKKRKSNGKFKKAVARAHELSLAGRPPLSDRALGTPDPRFSGGLGGLIETDPGSFAKGMAALPFTIPPDLLSLLSQGDMFPARKNPFAALSQGGEPIREAIGADNFVGRTGEFLFPAGGAAKLAAAVPLLMKTGKAEALLGRFVTTTPGRIRNVTEREGGYLVNLRSGDVPEEGLAVAKFGGEKSRAVQLRGSITKNELEKFTEQNRAQLDNVNLYLGTWMERDTGITYLDMSKVFRTDEMRAATKFGEKSGQTSGFRIGMGEEFPIGSWDEFLNSKEFSQRMSQMEKVGQDYLARQPTAEWWDVHGTVFEAVYGKENLRVMAGFMASTSPNTNPQQNLRFMTEYMRRHLIGEDIVQPAWRIPETGTINRTPGVQIGMEAPRSPNLLRSAAGDIEALQANKVRSMAQALLGDPNAAVFDRHWARLAEDPVNGIHTASREAVVPPGEPFQKLDEVVAAAAKERGRTPRDFSADVWTGIRETIKNTSELFGQKFRGFSVMGESKGMADIFEDLIAAKAKHAGVSVGEFKNRLGKGDVELLSAILATPLGAYAFQQMLGATDAPSTGRTGAGT